MKTPSHYGCCGKPIQIYGNGRVKPCYCNAPKIRKSWGNLNPATQIIPNKKKYKRNKIYNEG